MAPSHRFAGLAGALAACAWFAAWSPAWADAAAEGRLRDQLRQTVTELRQLQDENIELKARLAAPPPAAPAVPPAEPEQQRQQSRQLQQLRAAAQRAEQDAAAQREQLDQARQQLSAAQAAAALSEHKLRELGQRLELAGREAQAQQLRFDDCQAKNRQMAGLFDELLDQFRHRGVVDALLAHEPLTGLKRVQLERLTEEYRMRAQARPGDGKPAAAAPAGQPVN